MQILRAAAFGASGALKLGGATMMIAKFEMIGLAHWLRYCILWGGAAGDGDGRRHHRSFRGAGHFDPISGVHSVGPEGTVAYFTTVGRSNTRAELCSCPEHIQARPDCEAAAPVTMAVIG